jgi:hypothetical protein
MTAAGARSHLRVPRLVSLQEEDNVTELEQRIGK